MSFNLQERRGVEQLEFLKQQSIGSEYVRHDRINQLEATCDTSGRMTASLSFFCFLINLCCSLESFMGRYRRLDH